MKRGYIDRCLLNTGYYPSPNTDFTACIFSFHIENNSREVSCGARTSAPGGGKRKIGRRRTAT